MRTAQRSSTGSEWINWHTFNWEGSFKKAWVDCIGGELCIPICGEEGPCGLDADRVELADRVA